MTPGEFLNEFGAFANAPGGVQRLREMILQLAITGKLVEQLPGEEPASKLIVKIIAEKNSLLKTKIIKKGKKLDPISKEDIYVKIPNSWEWVRLQFVGNIFNGNSINARVKSEKYLGKKDGMPFIATKDVEYGFTALNYKNGVKIPVDEASFKVAHNGAILICVEGGSAGKNVVLTGSTNSSKLRWSLAGSTSLRKLQSGLWKIRGNRNEN